MNAFSRGTVVLAFSACAVVLACCTNSNVNIPAGGHAAPTSPASITPTSSPTATPTAGPTATPTSAPTATPTAPPSPSACTVGFGPGPDPASAPTQIPINGGAAVTSTFEQTFDVPAVCDFSATATATFTTVTAGTTV